MEPHVHLAIHPVVLAQVSYHQIASHVQMHHTHSQVAYVLYNNAIQEAFLTHHHKDAKNVSTTVPPVQIQSHAILALLDLKLNVSRFCH